MDPFAKKHDESYKDNTLEDKADIVDNGGGSNYYSYHATPSVKRDGIASHQEQKEANLKSGSFFINNDIMNNNICNSNSVLSNENGINNPNTLLSSNNPNNTINTNNLSGTEDNSPVINITQFRYTPTINLDVIKIPVPVTTTNNAAAAAAAAAAAEEEEKITKIGIRGWKLNLDIMKALMISVNACSTITDIT